MPSFHQGCPGTWRCPWQELPVSPNKEDVNWMWTSVKQWSRPSLTRCKLEKLDRHGMCGVARGDREQLWGCSTTAQPEPALIWKRKMRFQPHMVYMAASYPARSPLNYSVSCFDPVAFPRWHQCCQLLVLFEAPVPGITAMMEDLLLSIKTRPCTHTDACTRATSSCSPHGSRGKSWTVYSKCSEPKQMLSTSNMHMPSSPSTTPRFIF